MDQPIIQIPYKYTPRWYQLPLLRALDEGIKRAFCFWHRRAGKDKTLWNYAIARCCDETMLAYYFLPTYTQGKKVIWDGMDKEGLRFLDHIPKQLLKSKNDTEMKIVLAHGSIIQVIGTDNFDAIRGTNPKLCIFSEFAFQDPRVWGVVRPILDENKGTAIFNSTPNGENHAYDLWVKVQDQKSWFTQVLTIDDTKALPYSVIEDARMEGVDEDTIQREYYCSFSASVMGAYYGSQMKDMKQQNRLTIVPYQNTSLVHTGWDLGRNDTTCIWFIQQIGKAFHIIDCYECSGEDIGHYISILKKKENEGYIYGNHYLPHDAQSKQIASVNGSVEDIIRNAGYKNIIVVPRIDNVLSGIQKVRAMLPLCWIDEKKCHDGISALRSYTKEYNEEKKVFLDHPKHDWSSNYADALRTFACGWQDTVPKKPKERVKVFDYLTGEYK